MKEIKRKDTIIEGVKCATEEPLAFFTMKLPKECKNIGKCADKEYRMNNSMQNICIQPDKGKLIVTNTHILHVFDIDCKGEWPTEGKGINGEFECAIDPKDISRLAGQEIDVAVWKTDRNKLLTLCEIPYTRTECVSNGRFPDWARVMPKNDGWRIDLGCSTESELEDLRKWVKNYIGSNKKERENRRIVLTAVKGRKIELEAYEAEYATSNTPGERLGGCMLNCGAPINLKMMFNAELFYYSILPDFDGNIWVKDCIKAVKFCGKQRESVLMPLYLGEGYCTDSDEMETVAQREQREYEEAKKAHK